LTNEDIILLRCRVNFYVNRSALEIIFYNEMRYINLRFTYLLTYFLKRAEKFLRKLNANCG